MSTGNFNRYWKQKIFKRINSENPIVSNEILSPHNSTNSNNPLLISKLDQQNPEDYKKVSGRIVNVIDIQSGGGNVAQNSEADIIDDTSSSSSSCISIDFECQTEENNQEKAPEPSFANSVKEISPEIEEPEAKKPKITESISDQTQSIKEHSEPETFNFYVID